MVLEPQLIAVETIIKFVNAELGFTLILDALPENGGMSIEIMPGSNDGTTLDKRTQLRTIPLLFLSKSKDQKTAFNNLLQIGNALDTITKNERRLQVISAFVKTEASLVGKEGDYWIYSMIADIKITFRKEIEHV